jgi:hypothetical protein
LGLRLVFAVDNDIETRVFEPNDGFPDCLRDPVTPVSLVTVLLFRACSS